MSIEEYQLLKSKKGNLEVIPLQAEDAESGRPVALKSKDGTLAVSDVTLPVAFVTSILAGESLSEAVDFGSWNHLGLAPVSPWDSTTPSVALDAAITEVALAGGRVAVEDGVIEEVPLEGGVDFAIEAVPMTGGDEFVVDGEFSGGGNTFIRGILKR